MIQQKENIEETLGNALILIKMMEAFNDGKKEPKKILHINENKIFEFLKTIIIGYNVQEKILFNECNIQEGKEISKKQNNNFKELTKIYGIDCTRLYAIDPNYEIEEYEQFITKLWNASRFIGQHLYDKKGTKKISEFTQLTKYLEKKKSTLSEFESRIIYKTTELQKEYEELIAKNRLSEIQGKMIHMIKNDLCDKYLEIQKYQETENRNKVNLRCLGKILQLLYPFTPFITQQIRNFL